MATRCSKILHRICEDMARPDDIYKYTGDETIDGTTIAAIEKKGLDDIVKVTKHLLMDSPDVNEIDVYPISTEYPDLLVKFSSVISDEMVNQFIELLNNQLNLSSIRLYSCTDSGFPKSYIGYIDADGIHQ